MKKVLVIDDNKDILELVTLIFERHGFEIATIQKGDEAFSRITSFCPQIILLDVFLGGMDGRDLCNRLKANPSTAHIPVIMFSAHSSWDNVIKVCNADSFIAKPFNINELVTKVTDFLANKN